MTDTPVDTGDNPVDPKPTAEQLDADPDWEIIGQFQFIDRLPGDGEVLNLLSTVRDVWGVSFKDYAEYVIPLPSNTKVKVDRPRSDGAGTVKVDEYHEVVTLYFSVAGRLAMLNEAQEKHGWRVDIDPEPTVLGPPGYLTGMTTEDGVILYRSYISIWKADGAFLGRRSGQATGRGDRPHEKAETAANGRAAAAWGFGVIPGSGIASIEEMRATGAARQAIQAERGVATAVRSGRLTREELEDGLRTVMEQVRQIRDQDDADLIEKVNAYTEAKFKKTVMVPGDDGVTPTLDLSTLKEGQVMLVTTEFRSVLLKAETDASAV